MNKRYLETIKALDGNIYNLEFHQARLEGVMHSLCQKKTHSLKEYVNPPSTGLYRCRVVYDTDSIEVTYHPYEKRSVKSLKIVYDDSIDYAHKYENREAIDKLYATKEACDDILIVKNSLITDTSIANIALYDGRKWITPKNPLLKGTTRARLLQEGKIVEEEIRIERVNEFFKVALMNAMIDFDIIASENIRKTFVR